ncbi:MAG: polynucleotide adenylyltransferase [Clostridia bacterium]|nr:polynucleotide adenylyltransferase [Clostridia bacterium]
MKKTDEKTIAIPLPPPVTFVMERLEAAGFHAYAVGGCVRDHLMGRIPGDYDVTTDARPEDMQRVFADCRVVETGLRHGTLTVVRNGMNVETTTYRIDGAYADGRHPDAVTFTDRLADDLCRRDFTINAMAYAPGQGIVDLFGGREDLVSGRIRCVGRAEDRFSEDGLRILRALRFASVLGFACDDECREAIMAGMRLLDRISRERIYAELTKLLGGVGAAGILDEYAPVLAHVLPPLTGEAVRRASAVYQKMTPETPAAVRYAVLLDSLDEGTAAQTMDTLKPSKDEKRAVLALLSRRGNVEVTRYGVKCLMRDAGDDFPADWAEFAALTGRIGTDEAEAVRRTAEEILAADECRRLDGLAVDGRDLAARGFRGPMIGETLASLLDGVMRGEIPNERDALLAETEDRNG